MTDKCTLCPLHKISEANLVDGVGPQPAKLIFIGEAIGETEAQTGIPFTGPAGQMFDQLLMQAGINRADCRISNICRCRPTNFDEKWKDKRGHTHYGNRAPFPSEIYVCAPTYLEAEIAATKPNVIVPVGKVAFNYISGEFSVKSYNKNEDGTFAPELEKKPGRMPNITSERGVERWSEKYNCKCIPIIHPSALLRNASQINVTIEDLKRIKKASETREPTPKTPVQYKLIDTWDEVLWALERLRAVSKFSFDLETTGFDYFREKIICWGFSWKEGTGVAIRWIDNEGKPLYTEQQRALFIDALEDLFLDHSKEIWGFNIKFDAHHAMTAGLPYPVNARDAMLAHHLLDSETPHDLKTLAHIFTDMGGYEEELLKTTGTGAKEKRDFLSIPWQVLGFYNCGDVDCTFRLSNILPERMKKYPKMESFFNTWIPKFLRSVTMMERNGVPLDFEMVHDIHTRMGARCVEIEKEFKRQLAESGFKFKVKLKSKDLTIDDLNLKSPKQLPDIFFRHFKMKPIEGKIGKTGPSLDKEVLDKLAKVHSDNSLLMMLVEYRSLQTNMNTALEGLKNSALFGRVDVDPETKDFIWTPEEARKKGYWTDGRVRCDYLLHGTSTGRTASRGPNLQNLKRATKEDIERGFAIRGCLQALPGWKFVAADLSGAELWTLQGLSKDNEMQKALNSPEGIHYRYASMIYQIPWDKVDKEQKAQAKRIVFRIIYGGTAFSLAEELEIPLPQAEQYTNLFFSMFPAAKYYFDTVEMFVKTNLYMESVFGRIRHFPAAASNHKPTVSEAMREAKNFCVQSAASDITQMAAYRILEEAEAAGMRFRQALNVHADNTFHVPINELDQASEIIKRNMEAFVPELGISTKVDLEISDRWKIADDEVEIEETEAVEA